ncbi:MAG: ABC-1 domain protein [Candidatus Yanofskybacteria bacterium GW2011_GWF2_43_596]
MEKIRRSLQISSTSIKYLALYKLTKHRNKTLGTRLRLACEELGFVFIKIGQILSTRYELLSREDCTELQKLLDSVPPIPYEQVEKIFLEDFKVTPETIFQNWNPIPIAS